MVFVVVKIPVNYILFLHYFFFLLQMLKNTLILLLLTSLFTTKIAFEHRKCRKINRDQIIKDCNDSASEETLLDNHIPERICSVIPHPKLIINPYKNLTKNEFLKPKNITALCLRCGTCLAIADKVCLKVSFSNN